jgi:lipopolysaccharide biosynthesis regulator YciM
MAAQAGNVQVLNMPWVVSLALFLGVLLGFIIGYKWNTTGKPFTLQEEAIRHMGRALLALVNRRRDEAMEHLSFLLNQTTENIDAYIALSNLYRDKGWFHRAIDIRRRLLARGFLSPEQRRAIMLGMVLDYQRAGFTGRAIDAMEIIVEMTEPSQEDYEILAGLYELAGRLQDSAETWRKVGHDENYAYVRTELARTMVQNGDSAGAKKHLIHTLKIHRNNPAALLLLADLHARSGKISQAEKLFDRLQKIRPDLTGVIADHLEKIAAETKNVKTQAFFLNLLETQKFRPRVAVRYASYLVELNRLEEARQVIENIDTAELAPEMMARLVRVAYACGAIEPAARHGIETIQRYLDNKAFVCHACKELVFILEWKCPKCGRWGTIRSRRSYPEQS